MGAERWYLKRIIRITSFGLAIFLVVLVRSQTPEQLARRLGMQTKSLAEVFVGTTTDGKVVDIVTRIDLIQYWNQTRGK